MAKGDDAIAKKRNKKNRKKQQVKDSVKVSKRVASIIAAKKRRKTGKRRKCQGMCFSLPTPEDPFNDRPGQVDFSTKQVKKLKSLKADPGFSTNMKGDATTKGEQKNRMNNNLENEQTARPTSIGNVVRKNISKLDKTNIQQLGESGASHPLHGHALEYPGCPSKFLILCLNSIQNALQNDGYFTNEEDKPLFVAPWGVEFWKFYSIGKDLLEINGSCSNTDQIAWIASTAADTITRKEKEGVSFTTPFLLFLVPSKEKATKVRSVCKPLKSLGIHTVSLHLGASLDHQIHGLRSIEPEFLVSTPERLLELISLKAIDISAVSLLVVDGLENFLKGGNLHMVTSIRQAISGNPQMVVFNDCSSYAALPTVQKLLQGSTCRLSSNSVILQNSCIIQRGPVCTSEDGKMSTKNDNEFCS